MASFARVPSAATTKPDPVEYQSWAHLPSHRRQRDLAEEAQHERRLQAINKARTRDMRVLLSLRTQTANISKGVTTTDSVEHTMRARADEAAHKAADAHITQLKRRLVRHAETYFALADKDTSGELDFDEWVHFFGSNRSENPLYDAGAIDTSVLRRIFDELDADKDGSVSMYEFITGLRDYQYMHGAVAPPQQSAVGASTSSSLQAAKEQSPEQLESPLARYRRQNRPAAFGVAALMKIVDENREPGKNLATAEDKDDEKQGGFLGSLGMDTGAMEVEEIREQIQNIFDLFDDDESGFLDFPEVKEGLTRFGIKLPDEMLVSLIERVGAGVTMECDAAQFEKLLALVPRQRTPTPPPPPPVAPGDGPAQMSSESSLSSSSSSPDDDDEGLEDEEQSGVSFQDHDEISFVLPQTPPRPPRLRSPRATQIFHDDALQTRLKGMEENLKKIIHSSKISKDENFASDVQTGKLTYIAAEMRHDGALYSGPLNSSGIPEGVGALDYRKVGDKRGRLTAERRAYYVGTLVAGKRQGLGLLRWMDRTEYCGGWSADLPEGSGVETYEDGSWYAGGFKEDKRHGMGGLWTADGMVYLGQWQKGARHGAGILGHADHVEVDVKGKGTIEQVSLA